MTEPSNNYNSSGAVSSPPPSYELGSSIAAPVHLSHLPTNSAPSATATAATAVTHSKALLPSSVNASTFPESFNSNSSAPAGSNYVTSPTQSNPSSQLNSPSENSNQEPEDFDASNRGGHLQEQERIIEYGGPNSQYAKLNTILGRGAYKTVWKGLDREEGIEVAWNILETTKNEYSELVQETEILKKVRHPNVIHFHDSWYSNGEFVFITELMTSGTLREYIKKFKNPSMKIIKRWARQILKGLHYLHSQSPPIIHRDIKCDNIFINGSHGEVKIGDMGTAKMKFGKKYTVIGTPEFMAPEMYEEKGYSEKVDIYAFGMCLLEMVTGEYPYNECKNAAQIYKKVSQGIKPECLSKVEDKEVLSIILNCIAAEHERWSARKLLEHPFFAEDPDVSLLCVDETKTKLTFQVLFKGSDKQTVKFDFNTEKDTAENVVNEMIEEHILSAKFRQFVTAAIHKILRDLSKNVGAPEESNASSNNSNKSAPPAVPPRIAQNPLIAPQAQVKHSVAAINDLSASIGNLSTSTISLNATNSSQIAYKDKIVHQPSGLASTTKKTYGPEGITYDFEPMSRDYANDFPIEDFVLDVASNCNRDADKANEWLLKLKNQDIMTVGDLRDLLDDDWAHLNLTVFASRALKNGLQSTQRKHSSSMSPRLSLSNPNAPIAPVVTSNSSIPSVIPNPIPSLVTVQPQNLSTASSTTAAAVIPTVSPSNAHIQQVLHSSTSPIHTMEHEKQN
jgi:serine/threonine protein kinase